MDGYAVDVPGTEHRVVDGGAVVRPVLSGGAAGRGPEGGAAMSGELPDAGAMVGDLERLVTCESPSADAGALARSADVVTELGTTLTGAAPERIELDGRPHLRWRFGAGDRALLLGHHDTVWPVGSLAEHPWRVEDGLAYGPGCFDMKAGLVQLFHAVASLPSPDGVTILVSADEELGAPTSRGLVQDEARQVRAALVLEGSADGGALKTARKGVAQYELKVRGRAAHAGLEPWNGVNAAVELAHHVLALHALNAGPEAATVTPSVISCGTATNTVPAEASLRIDVRAPSAAELRRVHDFVYGLSPVLDGAGLEVVAGASHPPLEPAASAGLYELATKIAARQGLREPGGTHVGGGSDGNLTAAAGTPTLDGLGAVGGNAHAPGEYVVVEHMPVRAGLVAGLVAALLDDPLAAGDWPSAQATGPDLGRDDESRTDVRP